MLMQNVVLATVATLIFYQLNKSKHWYFLTDIQYALIFVAVALGMSLLDRYQGFSLKQEVKEFAHKMGLVDNPVVKESIPDDNGEQIQACYQTPFKVIRTQYGDRGLLAGYNEHVEAYQQGGINQSSPDAKIYIECMESGNQILAVEQDVPAPKV